MGPVLYDTVAAQLVQVVPQFLERLEEHAEDYGEVLPHVLFGDLTRFTIETCRRARREDRQAQHTLEAVLQFIEAAANSDDQRVVELVQVSFMENLHQADDCYWRIVDGLGSMSRRLLDSTSGS